MTQDNSFLPTQQPVLSSPPMLNFIGIDVGKTELVACLQGNAALPPFPNTAAGISQFLENHQAWWENAYVVVDATGGWERAVITALLAKKVTVHRADGRKAKSFARSLGQLAKTDALDAKLLARYGKERHMDLPTVALADENLHLLQSLVTRRTQLALYAEQEKQRLSAPLPHKVRCLTEQHPDHLLQNIEDIEAEIATCIDSTEDLRKKAELMATIPGIGAQTSARLLAEMPELGQLDRKQIASLARLAPYAFDSGKMQGRRSTYGGRTHVKAALFLAALNAAHAKDNPFRAFYEKLLKAGKSKRCALIATARKIIVTLNAKLRDTFFPQPKFMSR
jgi:transposase